MKLELALSRITRSAYFTGFWFAALMGTGCQTYAPKPPDLRAHHEAWIDRHPSSDEIKRFADALLEGGTVAVSESPDGRLTVDQAEIVALLFNADLRLARARAGIAQASADYSGLWDDPVLSVGLERMLSSGPHPWMAMTSVGFTLPISGRLEIEKQRATAAHHAALYAIYEQEWQIRVGVRRAWIAWSAAMLKRDVTLDFLDGLDRIVDIVTQKEQVGELARVQGRLFHIEHAQRRNQLRDIEGEVGEHELALRQLLGLSPTADISPAPQIGVDRPTDASEASVTIREQSPRLRTLLAEYDTTERGLELAIRRQYPDLTISPGYNYEDGTNRLLFGLSLPLPIFNRNQQQVAEATAEREQALAVLETTYESLMIEYAMAEVRLGAIQDQYDRMRSTIIPMVDLQYEEARRIAELGEVDTLLLLDTLRRQYETKLELIELEAKRSTAIVRMRELLGPPQDDAIAYGIRGHDASQKERLK